MIVETITYEGKCDECPNVYDCVFHHPVTLRVKLACEGWMVKGDDFICPDCQAKQQKKARNGNSRRLLKLNNG